MSDKPTLHEIAAMPFPHSRNMMRQHYDRHWGEYVPEGEGVKKYSVRVEYSYQEYDSRTYDIQAFSAEEAKQLAEDQFDKDISVEDDADVRDVDVEEVGDA